MLDISELGLLEDPFPDLPWPRARRRVAKSTLWRRRLAKRNAVICALAADRTGTARGIARGLYRELRRAAGRPSRLPDADARVLMIRRFFRLNGARPLSEGTIRGVLAGPPLR